MRSDEETLIRDFQNGDDLAFVALYNRYKRSVHIFCMKMLMNDEAARDCVQEVFLRVYEHRGQLLQPERFTAWLFTIARNQCLSYYRSTKHEVSGEIDFESLSSSPETAPDNLLERAEITNLLNSCISQLKMEYREVLLLREYLNLSYKEIAEVLGDTESAVKSRIFKARQRLYEMLRPILRERG
jgi:RNA polymerase sigma-70 factor (ECF subfamily)